MAERERHGGIVFDDSHEGEAVVFEPAQGGLTEGGERVGLEGTSRSTRKGRPGR